MENKGAYERKELFPPIYPFVKWAGGKTQLLHQLNALAPTKFDRYFEPFLGEGAFNVPWGKYRDPVICDSKNLRNLSFVLQQPDVFIQVGDYKELLLKETR